MDRECHKEMIEQHYVRINDSFLSAVSFQAEGAVSCVVFIHSYTGFKDEHDYMMCRLAKKFSDCGISSLLFDMRGHGESDMLLEDISFDTMCADAAAAVSYAYNHIAEKVYVVSVGFSARIAASLKADGYIMLSPVFDIPESLRCFSECADMNIEQALSDKSERAAMETDMQRMGMLPRFVTAELVNTDIFSLPEYEGEKIIEKTLLITAEGECNCFPFLENSKAIETAEGGIMFRSPETIEQIAENIAEFILEQ